MGCNVLIAQIGGECGCCTDLQHYLRIFFSKKNSFALT